MGSRHVPAPAPLGNLRRLVHGAYSPRTVEPVAAAIAEQVLAAAPYLRDPKYAGVVESYAATQARLRLLHRWLGDKGMVTRKGRPYAAAEYLLRMERLALEQARELGLTPRAAAALGRDLTGTEVDLARLWSMGQDAGTPLQGATPASKPDGAEQPDTVPEADGNDGAAPAGNGGGCESLSPPPHIAPHGPRACGDDRSERGDPS